MTAQIRPYTTADLDFVKNAFEALHDSMVAMDPEKRIRKQPGYMAVFFKKFLDTVNKNSGAIFIAEMDGKKMGFVSGFVADQQEAEDLLEVIPSQVGVISDLYVLPENRKQGVGKSLLQAIEKYLIEKKCDSLWINTNGFNTGALSLYHSQGFADREIWLMKNPKS